MISFNDYIRTYDPSKLPPGKRAAWVLFQDFVIANPIEVNPSSVDDWSVHLPGPQRPKPCNSWGGRRGFTMEEMTSMRYGWGLAFQAWRGKTSPVPHPNQMRGRPTNAERAAKAQIEAERQRLWEQYIRPHGLSASSWSVMDDDSRRLMILLAQKLDRLTQIPKR